MKWIIITVVILLLIVVLYRYLRKVYTENSNVFILTDIYSNRVSTYPDTDIKKPKDNINFSINLGLFIDNYYENHGYWRHIFHKGTPIDKIEYQYIDEYDDGWGELVADYPIQCPGLWLHPNKNTLRFVIQTQYQDKKTNITEHAFDKLYSSSSYNWYGSINKELKEQIEYFDIENIPIRKVANFTFVIRQGQLVVYLDGNLHSFFTLEGVPKINMNSLYIHGQRSYTGHMTHLKIYPIPITDKKALSL